MKEISRAMWAVVAVVSGACVGCGSDGSGAKESSAVACSDGADNDGDGHADCDDQDCLDFAVCVDGGDGDADSDSDGDGDSDADGDADEECNGLDDDGDGQIDEGASGTGVACLTGLAGPCTEGLTGCEAGAIDCFPNVLPVPETCANAGEDDDCNGEADDVEGEGAACETGIAGSCGPGTRACVQGALVCVPNTAGDEGRCPNGVDEDCDGDVDDGTGPVAEGCANMGVDDDCNGFVDDILDLGESCVTGLDGWCLNGTTACENGDLVCDGWHDPIDERCENEIDEDCDGETDEADCLDPHLHHTGWGHEWIDDELAGLYNDRRASATCWEHLRANAIDDGCAGTCLCGDPEDLENRSLAVSNASWEGGPAWCWFYLGPMTGLTTHYDDPCNLEEANAWD